MIKSTCNAQIGDTIVPAQPGQVSDVIGRIKDHTGRPLAFQVQRGDALVELTAVPEPADDGSGRIGVLLAANTKIDHTLPSGVGDAVAMASGEFGRLMGTVTNGLAQLVTNFSKVSDQISGPVAIVAQVGRAACFLVWSFVRNVVCVRCSLLRLAALGGSPVAVVAQARRSAFVYYKYL